MELSLFLAKFLGLYMLIIAAIWVLRKKPFEAVVREIILSDGLLAFSGVLQILFGLAIVISHSVWVFDWRGVITLIGYLAIFQGVFRLMFPRQLQHFFKKTVEKKSWVWIVILIVLGAFLTYHGFSIS